ncbi:tyrosine phosphatase family protein [Methylobacterium oryzihabitans]|uniref:Protein tyrosine phosphatase n=1 Tax=Methylobacterium oryzihabitans TaxID=2499852 RepID=A0A3S2VPF7_9HYPH|nr:protein-tyrosine phosphatase family protein [Methylobacterium oryzihabitans]RVU13845.1 protein tyrosine phosphatase [Methylobacterium oryzihabitans]
MPKLYVCPLSRLPDTVAAAEASHVVTLINVGTAVTRPASVAAANYLFIGVSDITAPMQDHILPDRAHVEGFLDFVRAWGREKPLVIHCYAGISRSTAAAFIAACALRPERDEAEIAGRLRLASPSATPNRRLIAVADEMLGRDGRMVAAAEAIGRGSDAFEGEPFCLDLD